MHNFSRKIFLTLYFINWPNSISWLTLPLQILGNMCIAIIFCTVCDVKNFQIDYSFLIKPFFYITKMSGQKCKYLKSKKSFWYERNSLFLLFKGLSTIRNCLRSESGPLIEHLQWLLLFIDQLSMAAFLYLKTFL